MGDLKLKKLLIIVFIVFTISFSIKLLGFYDFIPWNIGYNDIAPWSERAFAPGAPYIDKFIEYPVVIGLILNTAAIGSVPIYLTINYIILLVCALVSTYFLYKLTTNKKNLVYLWALAPSFLWFSFFNWDMVVIMFSILALYYYKTKKDIIATIFLALGFATKLYPLLFLIPVLFSRKFKNWFKICLTFGLTFLVVNIYFIIKNPINWLLLYTFHGSRDPNPDSIWFVISNIFPNLSVQLINNLSLIFFICLYIFIIYKFKRNFIFASYLSLLAFLMVNKVFSPQFIFWLLPFFVLYGVKKAPFYALEFSNLLVLFLTLSYLFNAFPIIYSEIFVVARHAILILLFINIFKNSKLVSSS